MKRIISLLILIVLLCALNIGLAEDTSFINSVRIKNDKIIYSIADFKGEKHYVQKIAAYDFNKALLWSYEFPHAFTSSRFQMVYDDEYVYVLGNNQDDNFTLLKLNNQGECVDTKTFDNLYQPILNPLGIFDSNRDNKEIFFINHAGEKKSIETKGTIEFVEISENNILLSLRPYKASGKSSKLICTDTNFNYLWSYKPNKNAWITRMTADKTGNVLIFQKLPDNNDNIKLLNKDGKLQFTKNFKKNLISSVYGFEFLNNNIINILGRLYPIESSNYANIYQINLDLKGNILKSIEYDYKDFDFIIKQNDKYCVMQWAYNIGEYSKPIDISQFKTKDISLIK